MLLSATKSFQLIVEISSNLCSQGLSARDSEDFDARLGSLAASWILGNPVDQHDVYLLANLLFIYCGYDALRKFCEELEGNGFELPYDFDIFGPDEFIDHGHAGLKIIGIMDIYDLAARGRQLGWQRNWCPFRHSAETLWYAGWDGVNRQQPEVLEADRFLSELIGLLGTEI